MQNSERCLLLGAEILGRKLYPLGFVFDIVERGKGSGGNFTFGCFRNRDRYICLWFRYELGGVFYEKGDVKCNHTQYMQALNRSDTARYPGFGHGNEMAGFYYLLDDLEYCDSFLLDDGYEFYNLMKKFNYKKPLKGFSALFDVRLNKH